jgi:hypothetical protein
VCERVSARRQCVRGDVCEDTVCVWCVCEETVCVREREETCIRIQCLCGVCTCVCERRQCVYARR